ncbi:hypothetical protein [endosymbiont of Acanthamoeba sp. UWC8]|uniref:hypothetical protein n=1 Tax=endosymbiont of Acanthamoeba sp. UWC8 TaxID=86106 RepID=UPI0011DD708B|nr:hypothetical protein [endosymbiont of Acanthamoeba sp. UWC8]
MPVERDPVEMKKIIDKICDQVFTDILDEMIKLKASRCQTFGAETIPGCTKEDKESLLGKLYKNMTKRVYEEGVDGRTLDITPIDEDDRIEFKPKRLEEGTMLELLTKMEKSIDSFMKKNKQENKIDFKEYAIQSTPRKECIQEIGIQDELNKSPLRKSLENFIGKLIDKVTGIDREHERAQTKDLTKSAKETREDIGKFTNKIMKEEAAVTSLRR